MTALLRLAAFRLAPLPTVAVLALVQLPASAGAATAEVELRQQHVFTEAIARYTAAPGERNLVVVAAGPGPGEVMFRDPGATIVAGSGCTSDNDHQATCRQGSGPGPRSVTVDAGDLDDASTLQGIGADVRGGEGDDMLTADSFGSRLYGGPGRDTLLGGAGQDVLYDDEGSPGSADRFEGGAGEDVVRYSGRPAGVNVDLNSGSGPDGDQLAAVEDVTGTGLADVLAGDANANTLDGGDGNDRLRGRGGRDTLVGGAGRDTEDGGPGRDRLLELRDRSVDRFRCGTAVDVVVEPDVFDVLAGDCERVTAGGFLQFTFVRRMAAAGGTARLTANCLAHLDPEDCQLRVTLRRGGRLLGRSSVRRIPPGRSATITVRLSAAGRAVARKPGAAAVVVVVNGGHSFPALIE